MSINWLLNYVTKELVTTPCHLVCVRVCVHVRVCVSACVCACMCGEEQSVVHLSNILLRNREWDCLSYKTAQVTYHDLHQYIYKLPLLYIQPY